MDPLVVLLLVLFVGVPVLSIVLMIAFAASADYTPRGIDVRGGSLRGAIASAVAKILVGDTRTFQLPLVVELEKVGILGASTPLVGGATVRDIEWKIYVDGEHVSTVTEASSVRVGSRTRTLHLPVNAEVHLPRGLIGSLRKYRQDRKRGRELRIEVRGHVIVKHWLMTREMPVRVTRYVVVGDPLPTLSQVFVPVGVEPTEAAQLELVVRDPYTEEVLEGELEVALRVHRRLRPDPERVRIAIPLRLEGGSVERVRLRAEVRPARPDEDAADEDEVLEFRATVRWAGRTLAPAPEAVLPPMDEPEPPTTGVRLRVPAGSVVDLVRAEQVPEAFRLPTRGTGT